MSEFKLTSGSTYRVTSVRTREETFTTEGVFQGMTSMGSVDAMVLEVDDGTELLPTHMVLKIEVLEAVGEDEAEADGSDVHYM